MAVQQISMESLTETCGDLVLNAVKRAREKRGAIISGTVKYYGAALLLEVLQVQKRG